ncbi:hypothetical protein GCM10010964_28500 [Caldovatus sediminis]|uniref:Uncharacterized protein n=1 Tax=Caldovatus sediminis TaxID=2041189 RepID=A0A8J2ZCL6_9PROT|nr:hypothetical protein [Caldovatus sediminis]GGG39233.1 hypothetical protein GCM10010964_28500 [Caldovatus sediminis]
MGHQRLGKLPAHRLLPEIVRYLLDGGTPTADLVDQVTEVGRDALRHAVKDPVFIEALWLLVRLPQAAGSSAFVDGLAALGLKGRPPGSLPELLAAFDSALERVQRRAAGGATDLGEMARQAALSALAEALQPRLPVLWQPTAEDLRHSVASLRSADAFADLAQRFHSRFVDRVIHYFIDRNLHRMIGPERATKSLNDVEAFNGAIRRHCDEASLIMRAFARDWLGKNFYRDGKALTQDDVRRFASYSVEKLRIELAQRKGTS